MKESEVLKKQLQLISERILIEGARMPSESLIIDYDNGGAEVERLDALRSRFKVAK